MAQSVAQRLVASSSSQAAPQVEECAIISIIGSGFWQSPETMIDIGKVVQEPQFIDVKNNAITIAVNNDVADTIVKELHRTLIA
jgi:aspartokinase